MMGLLSRRNLALLAVLARPKAAAFVSRASTSFRSSAIARSVTSSTAFPRPRGHSMTCSTSRLLSSAGSSDAPPDIKHIGRVQMQEILEDYEEGSDSPYCVIDVRGPDEIAATGPLSPSTHTLPIQVIVQLENAFLLSDDDFEDQCGFSKPLPDETLVFSCAAGVRSIYACNFAAAAGYTKLVNYMGGSNEWFAPS